MGGKELTTKDFDLSLTPEDESGNVCVNYSTDLGYSGCEPVSISAFEKCRPGQKLTWTRAELRDFESDEDEESDDEERKTAQHYHFTISASGSLNSLDGRKTWH